jgi:hypothetical protein
MLGTTAAMSPSIMPERNGRDKNDGEDLDTPRLTLTIMNHSDYTNPPEDED